MYLIQVFLVGTEEGPNDEYCEPFLNFSRSFITPSLNWTKDGTYKITMTKYMNNQLHYLSYMRLFQPPLQKQKSVFPNRLCAQAIYNRDFICGDIG